MNASYSMGLTGVHHVWRHRSKLNAERKEAVSI